MIGEDDVLLREGVARVLAVAGFEVVARAGDADDLLRKGLAHRPDRLVAGINMPAGHGDDGLVAALEVRRQRPQTGVLVLSQYCEERYPAELLADGAGGVGYLLMERVGRVEQSRTPRLALRRAGARSIPRSSHGCSAGAEI